jgi:YbgC/YbaW family acyl-CoA thioester hydrolase
LGAAFSVKRRVQFSETDVAGIVHFSNFFRYFEDAEHALWREAGLCIHPPESPIGWPRVAASCEYHRPLKFEQEFTVTVAIGDITRRAISYHGTIALGQERIATGTWKTVCVTKSPDGRMRSADIPSGVAERLEPFVDRASPPAPRASHTP